MTRANTQSTRRGRPSRPPGSAGNFTRSVFLAGWPGPCGHPAGAACPRGPCSWPPHSVTPAGTRAPAAHTSPLPLKYGGRSDRVREEVPCSAIKPNKYEIKLKVGLGLVFGANLRAWAAIDTSTQSCHQARGRCPAPTPAGPHATPWLSQSCLSGHSARKKPSSPSTFSLLLDQITTRTRLRVWKPLWLWFPQVLPPSRATAGARRAASHHRRERTSTGPSSLPGLWGSRFPRHLSQSVLPVGWSSCMWALGGFAFKLPINLHAPGLHGLGWGGWFS